MLVDEHEMRAPRNAGGRAQTSHLAPLPNSNSWRASYCLWPWDLNHLNAQDSRVGSYYGLLLLFSSSQSQ